MVKWGTRANATDFQREGSEIDISIKNCSRLFSYLKKKLYPSLLSFICLWLT